jgi:hypothetical protein
MHMADYLKDNPGSRTAILSYVKIDAGETEEVVKSMRIHALIQQRAGRDFWPQIAIETSHMGLAEFSRDLSTPGTVVNTNVHLLAREVALYRGSGKWFFIRPFSEMNDATAGAPWEFGSTLHRNSPQDLAHAWMLLRSAFNDEGATNAIFIFSPLAAYRVHREKDVLAALNLIPVGDIDAFGVNLYSRPMTAYGGSSAEPIPFAQLAQPWLGVLASSHHHGIPLAVAEIGVSNQAVDSQRARWLNEAFGFAQHHGFVMLTYFNYPHPYWRIEDQTFAGQALWEWMNKGRKS